MSIFWRHSLYSMLEPRLLLAVRDRLQYLVLMINLTLWKGWTVTYIISARGGGPSSGYISTGFFGGMQQRSLIEFDLFSYSVGLMVGRVIFLWFNEKVDCSIEAEWTFRLIWDPIDRRTLGLVYLRRSGYRVSNGSVLALSSLIFLFLVASS
jgi:hypothetical protein